MPPSRFNLARYVLEAPAQTQPEHTALIIAGGDGTREHWSYGALAQAVCRLAGGLRAAGLEPGDRLLLRMDNETACVLTFFAAIAAGLVPVPTAPALTADELHLLLEDSAAAGLAVSAGREPDPALLPPGVRLFPAASLRGLADSAPPQPWADTAADDPAFLIYTSGTTGRPKGVLHAQRSAWGRRPMYAGWSGLTATDVLLHAGAFNWTYTLGVGLIDPWANGATAVLARGMDDPAVWPRLIQEFQATVFATVPALYRRILKYGELSAAALASLRHGLSAGEPLLPELLAAWQARTGRPLYEALGMSEVSTYISTGPGMVVKPGSPGRPQPGRQVAILDPDSLTAAARAAGESPRRLPPGAVGLLAVHRGDPGLMLGYWRRPEDDAQVWQGDWFVGGDRAAFDTDGYVWFHGRADDILKVQGYRLSPQEIEAVLIRHPAVAEVAVGLTRRADGLAVLTAFVVPCDIDSTHDLWANDLLRWAAEHLAAYKCPRHLVRVESLPRTANGKLQRQQLGDENL